LVVLRQGNFSAINQGCLDKAWWPGAFWPFSSRGNAPCLGASLSHGAFEPWSTGGSAPSHVFQKLFGAFVVEGPDQQCPWWWPGPRCAARVGGLGSLALHAGYPPAPQLPAEGFSFVSAGTLLNLTVSDHGRSDSLLLSWDEPDGGAEGYSLTLSSLGSGTPLQNGSAGPNITNFWFHGLTPGMHYEIEVTATLACMETTSQTVTAQTSKGFPRDCRVKVSQRSYQ